MFLCTAMLFFPSLFCNGRNGWPSKVDTQIKLVFDLCIYHLITKLTYVILRSLSEEFKVPDGMVGFSKFPFTI